MTDYGLLYAAARERVSALVTDLADGQLSTSVPSCPGWTVHDVVAHLAGTVADVQAGRLDGVGSDPWTAAQVEARRATPVDEIVEEWAAGSPTFEDGLRALGPAVGASAVS